MSIKKKKKHRGLKCSSFSFTNAHVYHAYVSSRQNAIMHYSENILHNIISFVSFSVWQSLPLSPHVCHRVTGVESIFAIRTSAAAGLRRAFAFIVFAANTLTIIFLFRLFPSLLTSKNNAVRVTL